jgi:hypothetical protein
MEKTMITVQETTFSTPCYNHKYILSDDKFQALGYIPFGETAPVMFNKPKKFSGKGRILKEI